MCTIYVAETHDQVFEFWQKNDKQSLRVLHLDFHCDLRGMLIDREAQRGYLIWDYNQGLDQGNFLTHAFATGRVQAVRWVHDDPGGRMYDVGTVKYSSDFSSILHRLVKKLTNDPGIEVQYDVINYQNWKGLEEGEQLDIDWDFFACKEYPFDSVEARANTFLERDFNVIPQQVYVCYSPDHSHPTRDLHSRFVDRLATMFGAEIITLDPRSTQPGREPPYKKYLPRPVFRLARRTYYDLSLTIKKRGIY